MFSGHTSGINLCSMFLSVGQKRGFVAVMDLTKLVWCQAADKLGTFELEKLWSV